MTGRRNRRRKRDPGYEHQRKIDMVTRRAAKNLRRGAKVLRSVNSELLGIQE